MYPLDALCSRFVILDVCLSKMPQSQLQGCRSSSPSDVLHARSEQEDQAQWHRRLMAFQLSLDWQEADEAYYVTDIYIDCCSNPQKDRTVFPG